MLQNSFKSSKLVLTVLVAASIVGGCAGPNVGTNVKRGGSAYEVIPAPVGDHSIEDYVIGPLDRIDITVFQEQDISAKGLLVDAAGNLSMPLIGRVQASGRTATQLARDLEKLLAEKFYINPQVTISVSGSVSQRVTVQGDVTEPGIYEIHGPTTLLDALALAKGESENSALKEVVVIRTISGKRMAALFDVGRIRRGDDPDPAVLGRDVIIVGHSNTKQIWHDLLKAAPLLNVFAQI